MRVARSRAVPSSLHEALVEMLRARPELVLILLRAVRARLPTAARAVAVPETFSSLVPDYRADCVIKILDGRGELVRVVVAEVQLGVDDCKRLTLPAYQALARLRHGVPCAVVVIAPNGRVAEWLRSPIPLGGGSVFRAIVLGPDELRLEGAQTTPEIAFLRALTGGDAEPDLVLAAARAMDELPEPRAAVYLDLILSTLSEATRGAVEALMQSERYEFKSKYLRGLLARGREEGREEGVRRAIRLVLETRGVRLDEAAARRLDGCTDFEILEAWARRAAVALDAREIFAEPAARDV